MDWVNARRGQIAVATVASLLLHAAFFAGLADLFLPSATMASRTAPMQARVIPVAAVASEPRPDPAPPQVRAEPSQVEPQRGTRTQKPPAPPASKPSTAASTANAPAASPASAAPAASAPPATSSPPPAPAAPGYRLASELDPPPHPLGDIDPVYPAAAGLRQGTVVLRLLIGADGSVEEVVVVSATPEGLFEASAIEAFGKARFSPGRFLGVPVRSQMTIAVDYTPINRGGAVSGQGAAPR